MNFERIKKTNNKTYLLRTDFNQINNNKEAYLLGYLLGDGGYDKIKDSMSVNSTNINVIELFKDTFQPEGIINSVIPVNNSRPEIVSSQLSHNLSLSNHYTDTFNYYGITELKPNRVYRNIPHEYMKAFIIGFLDADGSVKCFNGTDGKQGTRLRTAITFTHPCKEMLNNLGMFLKAELNLDYSVYPKGKEECFAMSISGKNDCYMFCYWVNKLSETESFFCNDIKLKKRYELISMVENEKNSIIKTVMGIRMNKKSYTPFIILNNVIYKLKNTSDYDEAVKTRLIAVAENIQLIGKNGLSYYNPTTQQIELQYISKQDNQLTNIHVNPQGEITLFTKQNLS